MDGRSVHALPASYIDSAPAHRQSVASPLGEPRRRPAAAAARGRPRFTFPCKWATRLIFHTGLIVGRDMTETVRSVVHAWECDLVQHFTTAYYFRGLSSATAATLALLGIETNATLPPRTDACWTRFVKELRAGDAYHIESGVVEAEGDGVKLGHKVFNSETGDLCTTFLQSLQVGASPRPPEPTIPWEETQPQRQVRIDEGATWLRTAAGIVRPEDVDWSGRLDLTTLIHYTSDANVQFQNMIGMTSSYMRTNQVGYSTAEYQLTLHEALPESGTLVEVKSTLAHVGRSSLWFMHEVFDRESNRRLASLAQLGVHLDLVSRRPSAIPDEIRSRIDRLRAS